MLVLVLAAVIWGFGALMSTPRQARWVMIGLLLLLTIAVQLVLPESHPLRAATGGSAAPWLILVAIGGVVWAYSQLIRRVRDRTGVDERPQVLPAGRPDRFSEVELNRYARHIALREIGGSGQKALKDAKVLVVGAGGLGAPVLQYLAAAGVGTIGVIDDDVVENVNLQRQVIHRDDAIGMPKVFSAQREMEAQNPFVMVRPYKRRFDETIAPDLVVEYDLVLDGSDNFDTRYLVNASCVARSVPLVSGALTQWEGQLSVFDPARGGPCYECVFPERPAPGLVPSCAEAGVIAPLPGVIGSMMALEAVKLLTGAGTSLRGRMMIHDALHGENRTITVSRRDGCPVCGTAIASDA